MKKTGILIGIFACVVIVISIFTSISLNSKKNKETSSSRLVGVTAQNKDGSIIIKKDSISYDTIKALSSQSDVVVKGKVIEKSNKSRNLAKNPLNPTEDAKDRKTTSQEYKFDVANWLKGNGSNVIDIVYPEYTVLSSGEKISEENEPLNEGREYILFLNLGVENTYYGSAEPWQFKIKSNEKVQNTQKTNSADSANSRRKVEIITRAENVKIKDMKNMTVEEIESIVKQ